MYLAMMPLDSTLSVDGVSLFWMFLNFELALFGCTKFHSLFEITIMYFQYKQYSPTESERFEKLTLVVEFVVDFASISSNQLTPHSD